MNGPLDNRTHWPFKPVPSLKSDELVNPAAEVGKKTRRALTEDEMLQIKNMHQKGCSVSEIADSVARHEGIIYRYIRRLKIQQDGTSHLPQNNIFNNVSAPSAQAAQAPKVQAKAEDADKPVPVIEMREESSQEPAGNTPAPPEFKKLLNMSDKSALVIDYLKVSIEISELLGRDDVHLSRSAVGTLIDILEQP